MGALGVLEAQHTVIKIATTPATAVAVGLGGAWIASWGGLFFQPLGLAILAVAAVWGVGARRRMRFRAEIAAPGLAPGRIDTPVSTLDVLPTLADLVNIEADHLRHHAHD